MKFITLIVEWILRKIGATAFSYVVKGLFYGFLLTAFFWFIDVLKEVYNLIQSFFQTLQNGAYLVSSGEKSYASVSTMFSYLEQMGFIDGFNEMLPVFLTSLTTLLLAYLYSVSEKVFKEISKMAVTGGLYKS